MLTSERCGPFTVNNKLLTGIHTTFAKLHGISLDLSLEPPSQDFQTLPTEIRNNKSPLRQKIHQVVIHVCSRATK